MDRPDLKVKAFRVGQAFTRLTDAADLVGAVSGHHGQLLPDAEWNRLSELETELNSLTHKFAKLLDK